MNMIFSAQLYLGQQEKNVFSQKEILEKIDVAAESPGLKLYGIEGTNLYIIFFTHMDELDEYRSFQKGIFETIVANGGSLSHHHGVGRMIAPWMEEHLGKVQLDVLKTLKRHFDPNNIMNPGGQMGVDYEASDLVDHEWRIDWKKM